MARVSRFLFFVILAVLVHLAIFGAFVFSWKGSLQDYRADFFFWGGILRSQELSVGAPQDDGGAEDLTIVAPSPIWAPLQQSAWRLGSSVEKPDLVKMLGAGDSVPFKFLTERVELEELSGDGTPAVDLPEAPKIFLRRSGS